MSVSSKDLGGPVGVNLMWLRPGEVGGSEEYIVRQLMAVASTGPEVELVLFALPTLAAAQPELARAARVVTAPISGSNRAARVAAEASWLAVQTRRLRPALMHHGGGTVPVAHPGRSLVTIHDVQYLRFPEFFGAVKLAFLRRAVPAALRRADAVAVPSEFVRSTIVDAFGFPSERIVVVPNSLAGRAASAVVVDEADLRARYRLPGPVVLYPAITHPHKNHVVLIRAVAEIARRHRDLRLVLTGGEGSNEAAVVEEIDRLCVRDNVVRTGRIAESDLRGLYDLATVVAIPSRYEGFGVPVLEAHAHGVPVVAANVAALPEAVGEAGILLDPDRSEEWAEVIERLVVDTAFHGEMADAARRRARDFTVGESARALLRAYRLALDDRADGIATKKPPRTPTVP